MPDAATEARGASLISRLSGLRHVEGAMAWVALGLLVIACYVFEPGTMKTTALLSMLPFASILAIAAVGQCLTIQQGGMDLSVGGSITLAAALVSGQASGDDGRLLPAIAVTFGAVLLGGLLNGIAISRLRITPIIATLAVNALLIGMVQTYTGGVPVKSPANLSSFALSKTFGIPNTVYVALAVVLVVSVLIHRTVLGRKFVAIGANPRAANTAGLPVARYVIGTYMAAALCFGAAGIVLAGFLETPSTTAGNSYLFSTITAVVVGGTAFGGGRGRIVGTAVAAVFLTQLETFLTATGAPSSMTLLVQALAIAIAATLSNAEAAVRARALLRGALRRSIPHIKRSLPAGGG